MNERSEQAKAIFLEAIEEHGPGRWQAFVEQACAGDDGLRGAVEKLLCAQAAMGSFHEPGRPDGAGQELIRERPGTEIGPYKLMEQIGEGGMGLVFVAAQQAPVRRKVALKVIKPGMDTREVIARFEAERQVLALMDHPGIARVLDAGATQSGRPYFVMELVKGVPITEYCDKHQLTPRARLELFVSVCQAVQHAHQKGVIHRDVKPTNVLVSSHDGVPVVKVIDFGVAKALGQQLTEQTIYTGFVQMLGTPLYMSPEQAEMSGLDVDTRADIYALGVLLYELLTGTTPFAEARFRKAGFDEIRRIIREEQPPKPSTRLSTLAQAVDTVSANRQSDPKKLGQLMRRELDWIVMKCLEKDRNRRYETASALASDVQRYLRDEPVLAGPPGAGYRMRKFVRRHRNPVLAAALVLIALLAGLAGTTWGLVRAERAWQDAETARLAEGEARQHAADQAEAEARQRKRAEANEQRANDERERAQEEQQIADAVRRFLQLDLLRQADALYQADTLRRGRGDFEIQGNPTVRELLDRAAAEVTPEKIDAKFPKQRRVQAEILDTIGYTYVGVGEHQKAVAHLSRARDLIVPALGRDHPRSIAIARNLAEAYRRAGKTKQTVELAEQLRDICLARFGPDDASTLAVLNTLASAYSAARRNPEALALRKQVRDGYIARFGPHDTATLTVTHNLALAYVAAGKKAEGIALLEKVRDIKVAILGRDHPRTLNTMASLADIYLSERRLAEALPLFEQTLQLRKAKLGAEHPSTIWTMAKLGINYRELARQAEGVALLEESLALARKRPTHESPHLVWIRRRLAATYERGSEFARAEPLHRECLEQTRKNEQATPRQLSYALNRLGRNLLKQARNTEAEAIFRESLDLRLNHASSGWRTSETQALLGGALMAQKRYGEAAPLLRAGYNGLKPRTASPDALARLREVLDGLGELARARGDEASAARWRKERDALPP
jgi:non-specific serine/threonine protein kinase/serine/threonine-protein kinase